MLKEKTLRWFLPSPLLSCFFPFLIPTVSHNLAPSLASLFHFISLYWLTFFNLPRTPQVFLFPPLQSFPYCASIQPSHLPQSSILHPSIILFLPYLLFLVPPSVCLCPHPFHSNFPSILQECPSAVFFLFVFFLCLLPIFCLPPTPLLPSSFHPRP